MPVNADLDWAIEEVRRRIDLCALPVAYDEGRHRLTFATQKFRNAFGDLFREFADNLCDDVLDGITDRLQITAWSGDDTLAGIADEKWTAIRGEALTGGLHRRAYREGDGFLIVQSGADGLHRPMRQNPAQMAVRWWGDDPSIPDLFAKVWKDVRRKRYRANLYYQDRTERYASKGTGADGGMPKAAAFALLSDNDPSVTDDSPAVIENDDAQHVVWHFPNGEPGYYGRSLLAGVIPLQDALNKAVADMLVAMEFHAYPQRWATGVQTEYDADGNEVNPFKAGESRLWRVGKEGARFGQFDPGALDGFLDVQDAFRMEAARKGALPPHSVVTRKGPSTVASGISMLVAEGKTIKMARDAQRDWGPDHRGWMAQCLSADYGTRLSADDLELEWAPPETRDETALLENLRTKRDLGVPLRQVLTEMGYSTNQVDEFLADVAAEDEAAMAAHQVLTGGRTTPVTRGQAAALSVPSGPAPPGGASTPLGV